MNYREMYKKFVSEDKAGEERLNFLDALFFRKISIFCTIPISKTNITPTTITQISIVCSLIGFCLLAFGNTMWVKILGYLGFFLWALFDEIDGNIARYKKQCSMLGDLWDTMGGYIAMILIYFGAGIAAYHDNNIIELFESHWYLIIGSSTAIYSIFPRLMMHKRKSSEKEGDSIKSLSDKKSFSRINVLGMNLVSPTGFLQLFLLLSIVFHVLNVFSIIYFIINLGIMVISLRKILR